MSAPSYDIGVIATNQITVSHRSGFLRGLQAMGHRVHILLVGKSLTPDTKSLIRQGTLPGGFRPDFLLLFCNAFNGLSLSRVADDLLPFFPYVTVWDSNPLRVLSFLTRHRATHLALLVLDSAVAEDLRRLGYHQARYFPYAYADPAVFRPAPCTAELRHDLAFAGTYYRPTERDRVLGGRDAIRWSSRLTELVEEFRRRRRATPAYLDVFAFIRDRVDPSGTDALELSARLLQEQKWIEREQLFQTLHRAGLRCHVYGGPRKHFRAAPETAPPIIDSPHVVVHRFLDKHRELPRLYASTRIHLCCTQFPRACHERMFQAAACGAFLLHEWKDDVPALFEPGQEIVLYRDVNELPDLIRFFAYHEPQRRRIAAQAHRRFLAEHTPARRARLFTDLVGRAGARCHDTVGALA